MADSHKGHHQGARARHPGSSPRACRSPPAHPEGASHSPHFTGSTGQAPSPLHPGDPGQESIIPEAVLSRLCLQKTKPIRTVLETPAAQRLLPPAEASLIRSTLSQPAVTLFPDPSLEPRMAHRKAPHVDGLHSHPVVGGRRVEARKDLETQHKADVVPVDACARTPHFAKMPASVLEFVCNHRG